MIILEKKFNYFAVWKFYFLLQHFSETIDLGKYLTNLTAQNKA